MEKRLITFSTDTRLLINCWGPEAAESTGMAAVEAMGKKYYMVIPRIIANGRDAFISVLRTGKRLELKGHYFGVLSGGVRADIAIEPSRGGDGAIDGLNSRIELNPDRGPERLDNAQRLIETGKTATAFVHSVRNPLNAIKGTVVYLKGRYSGDPTLQEFASIIEDEIKRLDDFISRFLSSSSSDMELCEVDINEILKKIELLTTLQARSKDIRFIYSYGKVPPVLANSFQLEQAILNVINNALEALRPGEEFRVSTSLDGSNVIVEVSDTGPGIAQPGAEAAPAKKCGGRGFGLLITREIIRQSGGRVEIKSIKGGGTTVRMYLPVLRERCDEWSPQRESINNR